MRYGDKIVARNIKDRVSPGEAQDCEEREPLRKLHQLRKKCLVKKMLISKCIN